MDVLSPLASPSVLALWGEGVSLSWVPALHMALLAPGLVVLQLMLFVPLTPLPCSLPFVTSLNQPVYRDAQS